jgi:hypothetical protein
MRKDVAARAGGPALVVTYGNTTRPHRPLEGDLVILGRARFCDVALVSPEIAPVHCLLARVSGGWRLRDCTGRGGTHVNGSPVNDVVLKDGDMLQVGTFSFAVQLPPGEPAAAPADDDAVRQLRRSRRNLAHLALGLREKLRQMGAALLPQEDLDHQANRLRALQRDLEGRRQQQEQADAALREQCAAQERELAAVRAQLGQAQKDLDLRLAEAEARLKAQHEELEEARRQAEQAHTQRLEQLGQAAGGGVPPAADLEELHRVSRRLARFARKLRDARVRLDEQARELAAGLPPTVVAPSAPPDDSEARALRKQVAELQARLATLEAESESQQKEIAALQALEDAQSAFVELSGGAAMQALIASLRQQVQERDALLEKMNEKLAEHSTRSDLDDVAGYEAELNRYRIDLERDRRELNQQMTQLQQRRQDMEDALREAELEMARDRAQIAREQAELNRLRLELSHDRSRSPRDEDVKGRLANIQRLKDEIARKRQEEQAGAQNAPPGGGGGGIRSLFNKLTGSPA